MEFTGQHEFTAPVDRVWSMFSNPDAHLKKFEDMGHRDIELVEADTDEDRFHIVVRRIVDMDLPGFAKRVLKPTNTVTTTDDWRRNDDGSCTGVQKVDTQGAPVKINATTRLDPEPDGQRTRYTVTVQLDVKVPLIGGKLGDWAKGRVQEQLDEEFAAGDRWLASN